LIYLVANGAKVMNICHDSGYVLTKKGSNQSCFLNVKYSGNPDYFFFLAADFFAAFLAAGFLAAAFFATFFAIVFRVWFKNL
jgi:hypothetical protein